MDPFTARMLERARDRQRRVDERTAPAPAPAPAPARSPLRTGAASNGELGGLRQTDKSLSPRRPAAERTEDKENHPNALHESTRSRLRQLGSLYSATEGETDLDDYNLDVTPRHSRPAEPEPEPEPSSRPLTSSSSGLRTRLAGLASQYQDFESEVPAPAPVPVRQSRPAAREVPTRPSERSRSPVKAPADSSSPTRPVSRWQVRSPSPLRRQITAGQRPPPNDAPPSACLPRLDSGCHVAAVPAGSHVEADAPAMIKQYRPTGHERTTVTTEVKEMQGFTPSGSRSRLVYNFSEAGRSPSPPRVVSAVTKPPSPEKTGPVPTPSAAPYRSASPVRYSPPPRPQPSSPTGVPYTAPARDWSPARQGSPTRQLSPARQGCSARQPSPVRGRLVQERAAVFDGGSSAPPPSVDPTEMTLSDRRKLFEKGQPPKVIARFGTPVTPHMLRQHASSTEGPSQPPLPAGPRPKPALEESRSRSPLRQTAPAPPGPPSPSRAVGESTVRAQRKLWESMNNDWRQNEIAQSSRAQRDRELGFLANRWQHRTAGREQTEDNGRSTEEELEPPTALVSSGIPPPPPPPPPASLASPTARPAETDGRIPHHSPGRHSPERHSPERHSPSRRSPAQRSPSRRAGTVTDGSSAESGISPGSSAYRGSAAADESTVSYASGHSDAESLGAEILAMARANQPAPSLPTIDESSADSSSDLSSMAACAAIDDVLDDMDNDPEEPTPPKRTKKTHRQESGVFRTPMACVQSPEQDHSLRNSVVLDGDGAEVPLMHSVSFYRRQKPQEVQVTPVRPVVRNREVAPRYDYESSSSGQQQMGASTQERIKHLQKEAAQQMTVMSQASRALNLCNATIEFTGSAEMVEAERLLLVATHRRQAALSEIQRLKTEGAMRQQGIVRPASRGSLSVSSVTLPVKTSFVREVAAGAANYVYHFVVLLRYRGQVIATQLLSSEDSIKGNAINFPNLVSFRDLEAEFCVALEVYCLQAPREVLPHDAKYHIRKDRTKTPKKLLKQQSSLTSPAVQSPAGPGAVRATSFQLMGFIHLTARNLTNNAWALEKVPSQSPLDGGVLMTVTCHADCSVEERGFITVFDDVSGFGAWHRRWAALSAGRLSFWRYPEDESRVPPSVEVDLRRCVTEKVGAVPRDICARQNTLLLVTVREARTEDEDSLVMQRRGSMTRIRHLLSLDGRDERQLWADKLNETLANIRAWDPDAMQPHLDPSA